MIILFLLRSPVAAQENSRFYCRSFWCGELEQGEYFLTKPNIPYYEPILFDVNPKLYQCIEYARLRTGIQVKGIAKNVPINSASPRIGAIVKLNEGTVGHLAVIEDINGDWLILSEANLENDLVNGGKIVKGRQIHITDSRVLGYIVPF